MEIRPAPETILNFLIREITSFHYTQEECDNYDRIFRHLMFDPDVPCRVRSIGDIYLDQRHRSIEERYRDYNREIDEMQLCSMVNDDWL